MEQYKEHNKRKRKCKREKQNFTAVLDFYCFKIV